jgi:hypothetical protein
MKFQVRNVYSLEEMAQIKNKVWKSTEGNNSKIRSSDFCFLHTALFINEIYHPINFQVHSFYSLGEMAGKNNK